MVPIFRIFIVFFQNAADILHDFLQSSLRGRRCNASIKGLSQRP
jgi:hypothetical protein